MRRFLSSVVLLFCLIVSYPAEQIKIRHVSELITRSAIIARVKILAIQDTGAKEGYTKIAYAQISDSIKGVSVGSILLLENDWANIHCPNVRYQIGEDVLLFAKRIPGGNYETVYADAGKFLIRNESINRSPFWKDQSYSSASAEIKREMKKMRKAPN
jgi:hypothetical protein